MEITKENVSAAVPVTILATHGDIDASNYLELIATAQKEYISGSRYLLLDLTNTAFLSSAGLVALHSIVLLMRGEQPTNPEEGWNAFHSLDRDLEMGIQKNVKLLNPQARVERTLERTGLKQFFEIFTDREAALASYQAEHPKAPVT
jgi:anti-anti-sigma regulatory factor